MPFWCKKNSLGNKYLVTSTSTSTTSLLFFLYSFLLALSSRPPIRSSPNLPRRRQMAAIEKLNFCFLNSVGGGREVEPEVQKGEVSFWWKVDAAEECSTTVNSAHSCGAVSVGRLREAGVAVRWTLNGSLYLAQNRASVYWKKVGLLSCLVVKLKWEISL